MRSRNFTIEEAIKLNTRVAELLPEIQAMPFGRRIKGVTCAVDDDADPAQGFPEIRVLFTGKLSDNQLARVTALADEFADEDVPGSDCAERLGVRVETSLKLTSSLIVFRWVGLRRIDSVQPLDYFYTDGTFSPVNYKHKKVEGIVYYVDERQVRIISPSVSSKLPWSTAKAVSLTGTVREVNPFGIFEQDQPIEDLAGGTRQLLEGMAREGLRKSSFPALNYAASFRTDCVLKGDWHLPLPGDAVHLFSRDRRAELSRRLRAIGGKGLSRSCWLGVEYGPDKAYMVQLTTANSLIKAVPSGESFLVFPVAALDWRTIENLCNHDVKHEK